MSREEAEAMAGGIFRVMAQGLEPRGEMRPRS